MKSIIYLFLFSICFIQMKADKASTVINEANSRANKCGYVYGASGETLTEESLKRLKKAHPNGWECKFLIVQDLFIIYLIK